MKKCMFPRDGRSLLCRLGWPSIRDVTYSESERTPLLKWFSFADLVGSLVILSVREGILFNYGPHIRSFGALSLLVCFRAFYLYPAYKRKLQILKEFFDAFLESFWLTKAKRELTTNIYGWKDSCLQELQILKAQNMKLDNLYQTHGHCVYGTAVTERM